MPDTSSTMRLRLLLAYDGSRYCGWQIQDIPTPPPTVQAAVEAAVGRIAGRPVRVFGSGRTDAGVHAHGQVAHCDVPRRPGLDWRHALNALLPADVRVLYWQEAAPDFHARISALRKTYVYDFWQEKGFVPPRLAPFVWRSGPLDAEAMRAALPFLLGRHDFASFQNAGTEMESTVRELQAATLTELPPVEFMPPCLPCLRLTVTANGFLKQMVRNMAGLLAAYGRHKLRPDQIPAILEAADRCPAPRPRRRAWPWPMWNTRTKPCLHPEDMKTTRCGWSFVASAHARQTGTITVCHSPFREKPALFSTIWNDMLLS